MENDPAAVTRRFQAQHVQRTLQHEVRKIETTGLAQEAAHAETVAYLKGKVDG